MRAPKLKVYVSAAALRFTHCNTLYPTNANPAVWRDLRDFLGEPVGRSHAQVYTTFNSTRDFSLDFQRSTLDLYYERISLLFCCGH